MQEEKIGPILALFEIVHFHLMVLSHTELKPPISLRTFERAELFADYIPVLLGIFQNWWETINVFLILLSF